MNIEEPNFTSKDGIINLLRAVINESEKSFLQSDIEIDNWLKKRLVGLTLIRGEDPVALYSFLNYFKNMQQYRGESDIINLVPTGRKWSVDELDLQLISQNQRASNFGTVFIIYNADQMEIRAAEKLLKVMEEADNSNSYLLIGDIGEILPTIKGRAGTEINLKKYEENLHKSFKAELPKLSKIDRDTSATLTLHLLSIIEEEIENIIISYHKAISSKVNPSYNAKVMLELEKALLLILEDKKIEGFLKEILGYTEFNLNVNWKIFIINLRNKLVMDEVREKYLKAGSSKVWGRFIDMKELYNEGVIYNTNERSLLTLLLSSYMQ